MRNIKYIIINDSMPAAPRGKSANICVNNFGHHYVINRRSSECNPSSLGDCRVASEVGNANSAGAVLNLINVCQPGCFMPKPTCGEEDLNQCSIGIKYNSSLSEDLQLSTFNSQTDSKLSTLNSQLITLIDLLVDLRLEFPSAKILGVCEIDGNSIKPNNEMNLLRLELSNEP